ncbi:MAG TPA: hypothetical protein VMT31_05290 [Methanomicrobiales archaeon]|jgi:hypothetical protein|nr:hypothetical protein [Methanomicrobiales archaeon]
MSTHSASTARNPDRTAGVTNLVEYISITGILLLLLVVVLFTVNSVFMQGPADTLRFYAFTDIGNGMSVRIVDLYVIAPVHGTISTRFLLPRDVAGQDYFVRANVTAEGKDQTIIVERGDIHSEINIAGIGATKGVSGSTTSSGWNIITYNSEGF